MKIGDRVKVIFGTQLRNDGFGTTFAREKLMGYQFEGREGVVVDFKEREIGENKWGVHLDGDMRPDGQPDIRWFAEDTETSIDQVIVVIAVAVMTAEQASGIVTSNRDSVNNAIRDHNASILAEIATLAPERETVLQQLQGVFIPKTNEQRDLIARSSELHVRIANLKQGLVKEHTK